ncbi:hypothetical protein BS47DRAFT_1401270 [Hydnum rufescens UP504]|uniref:Uncharacterized protein n=1 Tax=Hydnum rufescens UP504 TaxID=1448309 RepID=A0A9P6AGL4_9AGAM|nr:hypothetical protein BS47DRAFT_1401270 [Hydnum rufescens UP504]
MPNTAIPQRGIAQLHEWRVPHVFTNIELRHHWQSKELQTRRIPQHIQLVITLSLPLSPIITLALSSLVFVTPLSLITVSVSQSLPSSLHHGSV